MDRSTSPHAPRRAAALLAAAVTITAFCAGDVLARSHPFGPRTRSVNDLGNQYVPFHAHLWDLLHGRAHGGLLVNWQSGYGASFLPDLGTYLGSPYALLVALFPRDEIDLAVYAVTLLKTATAAAAMAWLLLTLRPGRWWAAGLLGASYALCGWSTADASYNPMWLDGLITLPLLCLVGEWALAGRRRRLTGVLIVALVWTANFYTAYMATLGAALVLLLRLLLARPPRRQALATAGRAALTTVLGVGLAAPLVTVVYFGTRHAYPGRVRQFTPVPAEDVAARLLPATYGFGSPALYVGLTALLLALALPFHRAVPVPVRTGWTALVLAVALSLQWGPTHLVWHAFATPQGSAYRQAFVLCGLLVIAAWHALAYGVPGRRALGAATVLLALIVVAAGRSTLVGWYTWPVLLPALAGALAGLVLLARAGGQRTRLAGLAVVLLLAVQAGEGAATSAVATRMRLAHMDDYAPWGRRQETQAAAIAGADGWPRYRTDPGREQTVGNDPLLVGGEGAQYYSSLTSGVLSRTLTALGDGWTSRGRSVQSLDNAVTDVVFSVGARVHSPPDPHQKHVPPGGGPVTVTRREVPPLVTVRAAPGRTPFGPSPYRNQELLLGSRVYTVPRFTVHDDGGRPVPGRRVGTGSALARPTITARCPAGTRVHLWAPHFSGTARLAGAAASARFRFVFPRNRAALQPLGPAPASGRLRIELAPDRPGRIPPGAVGCLDTARLDTAAAALKATGATRVTVSDGTLRARLPAGSKGIAVVAAPRIAGWRCATGDGPERPAGDFHGLIAVPLDGTATSLTCTFHPPGLRLGTAVGVASLLTLALLTAVSTVRRRRAPAPPTTTSPRERLTTAL
ncbi:YfhO family protein [Streptomyces cyanogenus]|uniref:Bacterial membrane protein YfhO n=1 Tax=Streptomyces cyanogenus TaxID=80860 RepID=A0ABX7TM37_STRCY|nr:YfhO family protein [Streptomyces cyanogenus]QTD97437.1 Bacterial membrane protein YfhO [Streptomyces cyanogenus]